MLVPGAGLGRLAWDLALRGYQCLGIERAMTMLLTGAFVVEFLLPNGRSLDICPFVHASSGPNNVADSKHLSRRVNVPDSAALEAARSTGADVSIQTAFRMCAADFGRLAFEEAHTSTWDAVLFCFYIDACGDVVSAVDAAYNALRAGGLLISCGPLEYDGTDGGHNVRSCARCRPLFGHPSLQPHPVR